MARVIAICNQKGGVGKTTTAVNLGAYLAHLGKRVMLVDFDPQANASSALGHKVMGEAPTIYHGIAHDFDFARIACGTSVTNYHFIPANPHLAGLLIELVGATEREHRLRKFINTFRHHYDYVLIDLPPSLSLLTVNGLVAADEVLVPVQAEYYSLEGLGQLLHTVNLIRNNLKHPLHVSGAVLTLYDKREKLSREVKNEVRKHFPHHVFETEIPRAVALAEAPSFAKPILSYAPNSIGALAYRRLAEEVIKQEERFHVSPEFGDFTKLIQTPQ